LKAHSQILTDRVSLDRLTLDDHEFIQTLVNTKGWIEFIGERNVHSKEDAVKYVQKLMDTVNLMYWVVREKTTQQRLGVVTIIKRSYLEYSDIGFAFLPQFCGRGYAYEAAQALLSAARLYPEYQTMLATIVPSNAKSISLLTKLGFYFEEEINVEGETLHVYSNANKTN
jgi:Acetyltransferases, including N-acetylases of ribosomal proteins